MAMIIGIGYGTGGAEPLKELVRALPAGRGLAVAVVMHADAEALPSAGADLPPEGCALRVIVAEDGMPLQPDCLYVVPPTHLLSLSGGKFVLQEIAHCEGLRMPIDHLLCSLAAQEGPACCGVLLSGEGPDGTLGLSEIKAAGGRTIVQDPAEAVHPEMPRGAASAGVADAILPAAGIAQALLVYAERVPDRRPSEDDQSALRSILALLKSRTGHDFRSYKPNTLLRRARRRMGLAQAATLWDYFRFLQLHAEEVHQLRADLLIGVTDFFRQIDAWRFLEERVLPQLIAEAGPEKAVRAWVPACATGKEAYTLAMLLSEAVAASGRKIPIQIFATDADEGAIEVARTGFYPEAEVRSVSSERLKRFFARRGEGYQVAKLIRETVVFAQQNITSDPPFAKLDLVSCRNLLIYLDADAQRKAIAIFHFALRDGGCLFLGAAESVAGNEDLFAPLSKKWRVFRRLPAAPATRPVLPSFPMSEGAAGRAVGVGAGRRGSLALLAQQVLLERFAPAAAIADRRRRLLFNLGLVDRYLTVAPGEGSLDVVEMAREGLRTALRGAIGKAVEEDRVVIVAARVLRDGASVPVRMTVTPLRAEKGAEALLLVTFEDREPAAPAAAEESSCDAGTRQLEEELRLMREELQSAVDQLEASNEELKASNEEAMASNEELQSANEELETSKEELQSLNDELNTVNARLQEKNDLLESANNDLLNFLSGTGVATIFLDRELKVRRFTPQVTALLNLIASDVGRPLADIVRKVGDDALISEAGAVLQDLAPRVAEVRSGDGNWYVRRIVPYRTRDERIEGVVITYIEVSELKAAQAESARLASFPERNPNPVVEADPRGRVFYQNPAARSLFPDLAERGPDHLWLAGLPAAAEELVRTGARQIFREVALDGMTFEQALFHDAESGRVRIYGWDVTERRLAEAEIERRSAVLKGINAVFHAALTATTEEELGRACLRVAEEITGSRFGFVGEIGADGLLHDAAISDPGWELCTMHDKAGHRRPPGDFRLHGIYGRVLLDGRSFFTNDPPAHPDSIGTPEGHPALQSFLGVPLLRDGKVIGMIALGNREGGYRQQQLESLEALAPAVVEALQRARAEQALGRSEERLERAQAIAHLGSWELDLVDNALTWSDEVYRIFGLEPQAFGATYEAFLAAVHPEDRAAVDAAYSDSVREGRDAYEIEHRVVRQSTGEVRVVHERCAHVRDGSGRIIRSVGMVHDITERKAAEEALQRSLRRFELLSRTAGELLQAPAPRELVESLCRRVMEYLDCQAFFNFLVDDEAGRLHLNAYAGIPEPEARKIEWLDYGAAVSGCAARDAARIVVEHVATTPDERTELLKSFGIQAFCCHPLLGPGGKVLGTLAFGTCGRETFSEDDLSLMKAVTDLVAVALARMQSAERLQRAAEDLARSNQDLEQFAYVASHDLKEPLRAVSGFVKLLEAKYREALDEKAQGYIAHAAEGASRMSLLLDGLLEYSRVDSRAGRVPTFFAREAVDAALAGLGPMVEASGASVTVEELPAVTADRSQLTQVFQNLLANALKFRRPEQPPVVHVGARLERREWVFSVRDNGIGIAPEYFDRIFVIFQRLHTRKRYPGTGIGLAIVKKIVERHGGRVWLESRVGEGTTFFFSLPAGRPGG